MASMNAQALVDAGFARLAAGDLPGASKLAQQVLATRRNFAPALHLFAWCQLNAHHASASISNFRQAVAFKPENTRYRLDLAAALMQSGAVDEGVDACRQTIDIDPSLAEAYARLGTGLIYQHRSNDAIEAFERALALAPDNELAATNLPLALRGAGRLSEAVAQMRRIETRYPPSTKSDGFFGVALLESGEVEQAITYLHRAANAPDAIWVIRADYLYALAHGEQDRRRLFSEHRRIFSRLDRAENTRSWPNAPDRARPLRIGYLSNDFREHAVAMFIEPVLAHHDRAQYQVICYSGTQHPDQTTERLSGLASKWVNVAHLDHLQMLEQIQSDRVDLLIDLSLLTGGGRWLRLLSHRAAPVVVNYLSYAVSSGIQSIDWRISDPQVDPPEAPDEPGCERIFRLPQTQWCYRPPVCAPALSPLPAKKNGFITFGSTTRLAKLTKVSFASWCQVLRAMPSARLRFQFGAFSDQRMAAEYVRKFAEQGIAADRIDLIGETDLATYFTGFANIDIVLDTFPFSGGTTTCHAVWMGVPVVGFAGETPVSRVALSVLENIGHAEWVATDAESFVRIAVQLASDLDTLERIRSQLREQVRSSPLCDEVQFTRDLESAYRAMWVDWCDQRAEKTGA